MEAWVHGSAAIYHPYDERNVDLDGRGAHYRPGIPENQFPKVVDAIYDFQWPLVDEPEPPITRFALAAVLVRIRTYSRPDDSQPTGLVWVQAHDREFAKLREIRDGDQPLTSPDRFRVLRFEAPRPPYPGFDTGTLFGPLAVSLRIEGPGLAIVSGVGLALRPAFSFGGRATTQDPVEQILVQPQMLASDYDALIEDDLANPVPAERVRK